MAASRDLLFSLVIICLVLIRGYSSLPTTSQDAETNAMKPMSLLTEDFVASDEDYTQYEDPVTPVVNIRVSPYSKTTKRCDYNPCLDNQIPCSDLAASTGCLCPGFTLNNQVPEAPDLRSVSWNGSEVVVHWCAPYSYVTSYVVTVGGVDTKTFGRNQRSGGVGNRDHIVKVCVSAVNDAGEGEGSCQMYHPRDSSLPLTAGLIGGALGLLLLLLLGVLLWRHKRQRKQEASISMHDAAETQ
ncbi:LRRN4 C-terminal-like protein [Plectropomus leopardus]|uniref:LRRN4 C-terminal-like protein n=1 Tax=Plectropomus leopardus TaxID=160734 RepID=UPI001C4CF3D6|nr:LRRN4 C-terminal-like protein [Plectropomus leopardus]